MEISVGFSKHKGFAPLSWAIQAIECTNYSHAFVKIYAAKSDRYLIYQATGTGVYFIGEKAFLDHNIIVEEYKFNIKEYKQHKFFQKAIDECGKDYGRLQLVGLGLVKLLNFFNISIKNVFSNKDTKYICTEIVATILEDSNLEKFTDKELLSLKILRDKVKDLYEKDKV